jgi:hypothetical protein
MGRVKALRWTVGTALPPEVASALSPAETEFFKDYSRSLNCQSLFSRLLTPRRLLGVYMGKHGVALNLALVRCPAQPFGTR